MDEALAVAGRFEVWVLLSAGDLDAPHAPPGLVELQVNRVDAGVVGGHGVAHVHWDVVLLEAENNIRGGYRHKYSGYGPFTTQTKGHAGT